ncbi:cysteine-rich receptor-like protein kinase 5 isoform X2 [Silene latifolia]|uniref:cysteine-rich receptor-like protein kinase 5 isoform X2 n=1 Tax=Silene latifolia TaxID=37657 RepID=UPI003D78017A
MEPNIANYSQDVAQTQTANGTIPLEGPHNTGPDGSNEDGLFTPESLQYGLKDLQAATNNFSKDNKIGRGGFGIVYKGVLPNGQEIAVKRLSNGSGQGDKEFQTEVVVLAKLRHRNLVRLLGFCLTDDEAILVYEFVANKSLDYFLFDREKRAKLNWSCRFEIIKGVARGMMYIHEDSPVRMMHRDLKAANVLLDAEMYPKIADFGLARICDVGQTHINPTLVVGTRGYMAPEYLFHGHFSSKSDVYALGVLILEIVSGRRISGSSFNQPDDDDLLTYAWKSWEDEKPLEVMDPMLIDSFSSKEIIKCVQLGLLCVQEDRNLRPTMSTVLHMLNSHSGVAVISAPQHPAYVYNGSFRQSITVSTTGSTSRSTARRSLCEP